MEIRLAKLEDFDDIMSFYYQMTDDLETASYGPGWEKDVYPTQKSVRQAILENELFVGEINGELVAAMILNHKDTPGYAKGNWQVVAEPHELLFVHALGVSFNHHGKGFAKQLVDYIIEYAQELKLKAVHLDVLWNNESAKQLYVTKGFTYVGRIQLFYEDTGMTDYDLYEYIL